MRRIVFLQHGDFAETVDNFASGGDESYAFQRWSVDFVAGLVEQRTEVWVICITREYPARTLPNGVRGRGVNIGGGGGMDALIANLSDMNPSHVILRFPSPRLLKWCKTQAQTTRTLPILADSFQADAMSRFRLFGQLRARRLARLLNDPVFPIVANHNLAASRDLQRIGVRADKIVPWDWPDLKTPKSSGIKTRKPGAFRLAYVGLMSVSKGVMEIVRAVDAVRAEGNDITLTMMGSGADYEECQTLVESLGLGAHVQFLGKVAHSRVMAELESCDAAVVPSWPEYPEGLPKSINEALSMRTPVILSDHPMFVQSFADGCGVLFFRAKDHLSLASVIARLMKDSMLFSSLSESTELAWSKVQCHVKWDEVIFRWLRYGDGDLQWFKSRNLASRPLSGEIA